MTERPVPVLELRDLRKRFGATEAVAGVSHGFERGEYVCILGPSGCGKTTLLRMVAGFEAPSGGQVLLDGQSLDGVPPERRDVNVVFQSYALFPHLTVRENVAFGPRMKRLPAAEIGARVAETLRLVRMDGLAERRPAQLSGGEQQRVALARALVNRPRMLLLDEPLSALDRSLRLDMQEELRTLQRRTGLTFVHVTHDQGEALSLADRLVVMRNGRFEQVGPPRELYHRPRTRFVAEFLGSSNLLEGAFEGPDAVRTDAGLRLAVQDGARPSGRVLVSIRPEAIAVEVARDREAGGAAEDDDAGAALHTRRLRSPRALNRFPGRVTGTAFAGAAVECRVEVEGHVLRAVLPARDGAAGVAEGAAVDVHISASDVVLIDPDGERGP